ncbi:limonene-1,2-epoxide hydrolase family protein [Kaistia terrae]|uniref:Limonene-1,2-epoxide hydrolase family protein n=1 Tax=Kaistia terrae TaxID=537017 RepID=A0ABW0PXY1_9HYPH|nr:limonene-1,2-epoxide hydrolase family protein [Kaistia terrae]MCX5581667.1 hypothetical protein [Kaistia terrae]
MLNAKPGYNCSSGVWDNRVLTERLDIFERADGSEIGRVTLMGIYEIEGERIVAWRDYVDVYTVSALAAS